MKMFERHDDWDYGDDHVLCPSCGKKGYWWCTGCDRYTLGDFTEVEMRNEKTRMGCERCNFTGCKTEGCLQGTESCCLFQNTWKKNDGTYGCITCQQPVKQECGLCRQLVEPKDVKVYYKFGKTIYICCGCINRDWMGLIKRIKSN